ncbi:TetR/AcrR family transcriptional regulator C-terminal domain-containing protein [Anaerobacillus sp. CMMVII]|uniref:TetR-like C-terminal domain-containing protein n=1 Tax=Anaerobacillus sp. CMMVII TaxID=2755588 RepID=UPI0021B781A4|nr:TetR-like C-terminal domain-containing protein [Anaerobacillus sp. CMMVII]MCT8138079.1 TetR/AcrR family transcriptional regulator C-terminal domain-containing protein [Anaerobacillus sp. CMMVII]
MVDEMIAGLVNAFQTPYKNVNYIDLHSLSPSTIAIFDYILENAEFYKLMLNSNILPGFQEKILETIISLLKTDMVFQQNQECLNVKIEHFITYRAYGIFGLILEWVKSDFEESPIMMAEQLIQIFNFHTPVVLINK